MDNTALDAHNPSHGPGVLVRKQENLRPETRKPATKWAGLMSGKAGDRSLIGVEIILEKPPLSQVGNVRFSQRQSFAYMHAAPFRRVFGPEGERYAH